MLFADGSDSAELYPYMHLYTSYMKKMTRPLVGRTHEKQLVMAAMMKPELCNVLLLAEAGTGKAQPDDTLVPVADARGYVRIGDIRPGDFVFDEDGEPTEVLGVFPQGMRKCFEAVFSDGTAAKCCDSHLWNARKKTRNGGAEETHTLRYMIDYGPDGWQIPVARAVKRPDAGLPMDPYVFGAYICAGEPGPELVIRHDAEPFIADVGRRAGADGYRQLDGSRWAFLEDMGSGGFLRNPFWENSRPDHEAGLRAVAGRYAAGSVRQRQLAAQGMAAACGLRFGSEWTARLFQELSSSLGCRCSVRPEGCIYIAGFPLGAPEWLSGTAPGTDFVPAAGTRPDCGQHAGARAYMGVEEIRDLGYECPMTCIYVAAPSHLYLTGKEHIVTHNTALVQGIMAEDTSRTYLEVDLPKMLTNLRDTNEMADRLKTLFSEVSQFREAGGRDIVLFIDEFHQIVQLSPAAVEVLKPMLADSGTRGIRFIAATTQIEYQQFIAPNLPLVERLQRVRLVQPGEDVVVSILSSMCERYGVRPYNDTLFNDIYTYTNRYIPATSQPRKSILILDTMIGWHRLLKRPLDKKLLADVIYETEGINVAFRVDAASIKKRLDEKVLAQQVATSSIEQRMQICVAGLNNPNRPMSSFLFAGSTGVGKTEATKQLAEILYDDDRNLIRFDMTEFALPDSLNRFRRELTNRVSAIPYCLILLDEIEKACAPVTRVLLQVLDDGRLMDENEREVTFKNAYIIVTTNSGSEIFRTISNYESSDTADFKMLEKYDKLLREAIRSQSGSKFPPELLGRIDCIVPFQPLSKRTMMGIVQMKLLSLAKMVRQKHGVTLHIHKNIYVYLIYDKLDSDSDSGGARIVVSKLERELTVPLSRYINEHPLEKEIYVSVGGRMAILDKRQLESEAYVHVGPAFVNNDQDLAKKMAEIQALNKTANQAE